MADTAIQASATTATPVAPGTADALTKLGQLRDTLRPIPRRRRLEKEPASWRVNSLRIGVIVVVVAFWEIGATLGWIDPFFWSQPSRIFKTAIITIQNGDLWVNARFTFGSTIAGFLIGVIGGVAIGLSFWWSRTYALVAEPMVIAFEAMPKLALAPIIVLVLGIGISSKIAMAVAIVIVIQILNTYTAVRAVDKDLVTLLYSLGASKWQVFQKVVFPSVIPWVISSLRIAIGLALTGAVVGEYIGSREGLGRMIQYAGSTYDIALIWVGVFTLAFLSALLYVVVAVLERWLRKGVVHS
ncbi:ABC transporter permease [Homoserinimonas hongtaonis]|uniref:ABC transporter permease n=1 Tax=Homoserinimonas hongtaonis TaxID=2079791 RepID=A0A2U1T1M2_9MICO|nr:ABC transporter permease [Salinibacterium hongtaonis]AWB90352.1 ABC transporter permease [Salinibacterium hongtaonis]PWB97781.1 ABC transporter permease [Salinibacterium hongtaonis]